MSLMLGVDLGLNLGSITLLNSATKSFIMDSEAIKPGGKILEEWSRIVRVSECFYNAIKNLDIAIVAIETPVFPWGTRNPVIFQNSVSVYVLLRRMLEADNYLVIPVHNKTAKAMAHAKKVSPKMKKKAMIDAFAEIVGHPPEAKTQLERETLADSYFIALAGFFELGNK